VQENKDNTFRYLFEIFFFAHEQFFFCSLDCIFFSGQFCRLLTNWFAGSKGLMTESLRRVEGKEIHFFRVVAVYRFRHHKHIL